MCNFLLRSKLVTTLQSPFYENWCSDSQCNTCKQLKSFPINFCEITSKAIFKLCRQIKFLKRFTVLTLWKTCQQNPINALGLLVSSLWSSNQFHLNGLMIQGGFLFPQAHQFLTRCENLSKTKKLGFYFLWQNYERKGREYSAKLLLLAFQLFSNIESREIVSSCSVLRMLPFLILKARPGCGFLIFRSIWGWNVRMTSPR